MKKIFSGFDSVSVGTALAILFVVGLCFLVAANKAPYGISVQTKEAAVEVLETQTSGGVVLHGCSFQDFTVDGWIENTRAWPVRIRQIIQDDRQYGEKTQSMYLLSSGEKLKIKDINSQLGFYIYSNEGGLVGWISGRCPKH